MFIVSFFLLFLFVLIFLSFLVCLCGGFLLFELILIVLVFDGWLELFFLFNWFCFLFCGFVRVRGIFVNWEGMLLLLFFLCSRGILLMLMGVWFDLVMSLLEFDCILGGSFLWKCFFFVRSECCVVVFVRNIEILKLFIIYC